MRSEIIAALLSDRPERAGRTGVSGFDHGAESGRVEIASKPE
jgi:hypothetical protein